MSFDQMDNAISVVHNIMLPLLMARHINTKYFFFTYLPIQTELTFIKELRPANITVETQLFPTEGDPVETVDDFFVCSNNIINTVPIVTRAWDNINNDFYSLKSKTIEYSSSTHTLGQPRRLSVK